VAFVVVPGGTDRTDKNPFCQFCRFGVGSPDLSGVSASRERNGPSVVAPSEDGSVWLGRPAFAKATARQAALGDRTGKRISGQAKTRSEVTAKESSSRDRLGAPSHAVFRTCRAVVSTKAEAGVEGKRMPASLGNGAGPPPSLFTRSFPFYFFERISGSSSYLP